MLGPACGAFIFPETFESISKTKIRRLGTAVVRDLVPEFERLVSELGGGPVEVLMAQGHRWGVAFPLQSFEDAFYFDANNNFGACGDYFTPHSGRVEGAWSSGSALAAAILAT